MARVYQVPQHAFVWLASGVLLAALPHIVSGPSWLAVLVPLVLLWRIFIQRGRLAMPGRLLRSALLVAAIAGTLYSYGTVLGPRAGVCLLVAAFSLKLLEMMRLRDAYVLIVLSYFVLATTFLFQRGILATFYVMAVLVVITAALVGINHAESRVRARSDLRTSLVLMLQSVPLLLLLFVLVPRIGPLWSLNLNNKQGKTGMSDSMAPGEVSSLSRSDELAFRVEFDGPVPPPSQRYWRGLTYSWFDGHRWEQAVPRGLQRSDYVFFPGDAEPLWYRQLRRDRSGPSLQYRVIMEPTQQPWLYALGVPFADTGRIGMARDYRLVLKGKVEQTLSYRVTSYPDMPRGEQLADWQRRINLHLPDSGDPKARAMARRWRSQVGSDAAYVRKVLQWFRQQPFYYTLNPPPLGENTIDDFLFNTRRGFCEHYASSFAFLMRAAGIPARVVAGYQGGELNPLGTYLLVHQYDAHAWDEVWLPGRGWVREDPTAAVAPDRIEYGLDKALQDQGSSLGDALGGLARFRNNPILSKLRHLSDYVAFAWQKWVLGYNSSTQFDFLKGLLGKVTPMRIAAALGGGALTIVLVLAGWVLLHRRVPGLDPRQREFWRMQRLLRRYGLPVTAAMAPRQMASLARRHSQGLGDSVGDWARYYEGLVYGGRAEEEKQAIRHLRGRRRAVRRALGKSGSAGSR